mmetsp:Transcript_49250/g.100567  ORF Transcript_49250/g.100567 Transcript_49250/m.100567 type:complete len:361 (+) Transcript_49250:447-1529(+)
MVLVEAAIPMHLDGLEEAVEGLEAHSTVGGRLPPRGKGWDERFVCQHSPGYVQRDRRLLGCLVVALCREPAHRLDLLLALCKARGKPAALALRVHQLLLQLLCLVLRAVQLENELLGQIRVLCLQVLHLLLLLRLVLLQHAAQILDLSDGTGELSAVLVDRLVAVLLHQHLVSLVLAQLALQLILEHPVLSLHQRHLVVQRVQPLLRFLELAGGLDGGGLVGELLLIHDLEGPLQLRVPRDQLLVLASKPLDLLDETVLVTQQRLHGGVGRRRRGVARPLPHHAALLLAELVVLLLDLIHLVALGHRVRPALAQLRLQQHLLCLHLENELLEPLGAVLIARPPVSLVGRDLPPELCRGRR